LREAPIKSPLAFSSFLALSPFLFFPSSSLSSSLFSPSSTFVQHETRTHAVRRKRRLRPVFVRKIIFVRGIAMRGVKPDEGRKGRKKEKKEGKKGKTT
jgi:hypothetical protein